MAQSPPPRPTITQGRKGAIYETSKMELFFAKIVNDCSRSSRLKIFFKISVLKNFADSQENTCVGVSF